jgi:hypothetical protein
MNINKAPEPTIPGMETTDFGDLDAKIADTEFKLSRIPNAIALAEQLNDPSRINQLKSLEATLRSTLQELKLGDLDFSTKEAAKAPNEKPRDYGFDGDAFDQALRGTGELSAADKLDKRYRVGL